MVAQAREAAIANVVLLSNCRPRPSQLVFPRFRNIDDPLRAVFFSRISKEKGADIVLDAAERMPSVEFDLYGSVDQEYAEIFSHRVSQLSNVHYGGVLDGAVVDVLGELSRYDVHLFPSRWPYEGVPGVLVETKIAAVPSIVSDICYNAEIVADGQSGIVLKHNDADGLCEALLAIEDDVDYLNRLKAGAAESASPYYADACIDAIVALLDKE